MSCSAWHVLRRPEYREDLAAIESWIAQDNRAAGTAMWLLLDEQVDHLADAHFPRRPSTRVAEEFELVAHENYIVYCDQDETDCGVIVRAVVHVARRFP